MPLPRGRVTSWQPTCHVCQAVLRRCLAATEDVEGAGDALQAQHVVAVGGDVDLVDHLLAGAADIRPRLPRQLLAQHLLLAGLRGGVGSRWAAPTSSHHYRSRPPHKTGAADNSKRGSLPPLPTR